MVPLGDAHLRSEALLAAPQQFPCPVSVVDATETPPTEPVSPPLDDASAVHVSELLHAGGEETRPAVGGPSELRQPVLAVQQAIRGSPSRSLSRNASERTPCGVRCASV